MPIPKMNDEGIENGREIASKIANSPVAQPRGAASGDGVIGGTTQEMAAKT